MHAGVHRGGNSQWQRGREDRDNWELNDDGRVDKGLQMQRPSSVDTREKTMCTWPWFQAGNQCCPSPLGSGRAQPTWHRGENTDIYSFFTFPCLIFSWERTSWLFHSLFVQFVLCGVFCRPPVTSCSADTHRQHLHLKVMLTSLFG